MTETMGSPARIVLKLGGTSIATPEAWRTTADILRKRRAEGARLLVVHSALPGVTDALEELAESAGLPVRWVDARELLEARPGDAGAPEGAGSGPAGGGEGRGAAPGRGGGAHPRARPLSGGLSASTPCCLGMTL